MANVTLLTGGSVPKGLESPMKERKVIRITDIVRKENSMTDKEKIRKEVERLRNLHQMKYQQLDADSSMSLVECGKRNLCNELLSFIDSMEEEPKPKFKVGDRINQVGRPNELCYILTVTTVDTDIKCYICDQATVIEFKEQDQWELVEEPKKCMYSKDNYTEEDRKVLCEGCDEECEYNKKEEPVSEDFEKALAREWKGYIDRGAATVDALEDNTQELAFAKGFYRGAQWGKNQAMAEIQSQSMALAHGCPKESITELEEAAIMHFKDVMEYEVKTGLKMANITSFKAGARWQLRKTRYEKDENNKK